jgi:hypothetical protein
MSDAAALQPPTDDAAYESLVDHYLTEIQRLQRQMEEIIRLQAETRAILDDVMATLRAA